MESLGLVVQNTAELQIYSSVVKDENIYYDIVKEENTLVNAAKEENTLANTVKEENIFANAVKEEKGYSDTIKPEKNVVFPEKKVISDKKSISKNADSKKVNSSIAKDSGKGLVSYGTNAAKNAVGNEIENSDDEGIRTLKKGTDIAVTAVEIIKPEDLSKNKITKGVKRRTRFNKSKTAQNIQNLGIKAEFRNEVKNAVLQANNSSKKALDTGRKAILKSIRSGISEIGEDNLAFKAVDDAIGTVETAVAVEKGVVATVNSTVTAAKAIKNTSVAIIKAPKTISSAAKAFKYKAKISFFHANNFCKIFTDVVPGLWYNIYS